MSATAERRKVVPQGLRGISVSFNSTLGKWVAKIRSDPVELTDSGFVRYHHVGTYTTDKEALNAAIHAQKQQQASLGKLNGSGVPAAQAKGVVEVAKRIMSNKTDTDATSVLNDNIKELTAAVKELTDVIRNA